MKRNATTELNHENWNQEEKVEERGNFALADSNIISQRKVISARRKPVTTSAGVFAGFSKNSSSAFNFGFNKSNDSSKSTFDLNKEKHLNSLKMLNESFLECITKHVNENPICILTPTLDDYISHLAIIKSKYPLTSDNSVLNTNENKNDFTGFNFNSKDTNSVDKKSIPISTNVMNVTENSIFRTSNSVSKLFSFDSKKDKDESSDSSKTKITFGTSNTDIQSVPKTEKSEIFSFLNKETPAASTADFSFPKTSGFNSSIFGNGGNNLFNAQETNKCSEEEEYVPPTPEILEVKEKDSVYDIKCKLYWQKEGKWELRGAGNLFIKPMEKGKFQLVIRADNSLATILLNVLITDKTPMNTNKNNVSLVTMTNFDNQNNVSSLLVRVSSPEKAEELLSEMKKQL